MKALIIISVLFFRYVTSFAGDSLAYYFNLGKTGFEKEHFIEAIEQFDKVLNSDSAFYPALLFRGKAYAKIGQFELALADLNAYLSKNPKDKNVYLHRGKLKAAMQNFEGALQDFNYYGQLYANDPEINLYIENCKIILHD